MTQEQAADILRQHYHDRYDRRGYIVCGCGWSEESLAVDHAAHVAQMLVDGCAEATS